MLCDRSPPPSILIVDGDFRRGNRLAIALKSIGFRALITTETERGEQEWRQSHHAAVIIGLPPAGLEGIQLLKSRRLAGDNTPAIVISPRDSKSERLQCLEGGSDEFFSEPVDLEEIVIRTRNIVRRRNDDASLQRKVGSAALYYESHEVELQGKRITLTPREFTVAACLFESAGQTVSRSVLEDRLFGRRQIISSNALDVHIHNLRKKLGSSAIATARGGGYRVASALTG